MKFDEQVNKIVIFCRRDKRKSVIDPVTSKKGTVNKFAQRTARDLPLFGYPSRIQIELAQVFISKNERGLEHCEFIDRRYNFTNRFSAK
ncbi:MAG: hypothetical protein ACI8O8_001598 [Oleiphilaceae bacterium]|jgi:hypothetical protein